MASLYESPPENLLFRIGLEIETCFANKPSKVQSGVNGCVFLKEKDEQCPCPVSFLETTHAPDSLFKGVPEEVSECENGSGGCNVELIINPSREIFYNGDILFDKNGEVMSELSNSIIDWYKNGCERCGSHYGQPIKQNWPSSCGVHVHISAPFMEQYPDHIKELYKILVYYLWYNKVQENFVIKNPHWVHGRYGSQWVDAPYIITSELTFDLPSEELLNSMLANPDENIDNVHQYYVTLPGATFTGGDMLERGTHKSNIIIVDKKYNNPYPHFEFRGHDDLNLAYINLVTWPKTYDGDIKRLGPLKYIHEIYSFLSEAHTNLLGKTLSHSKGGRKKRRRKRRKKRKTRRKTRRTRRKTRRTRRKTKRKTKRKR